MTDQEDLDETTAFIASALDVYGNGFQVSDNDHAKQILDWLMELRDRRMGGTAWHVRVAPD